MEQVAGLLSDLKVSTHRINQVLGDKKLLASIKETVSSLQDVARSANELTTAATALVKQMSPDVRKTFSQPRSSNRRRGESERADRGYGRL